MHKTAFLIIIGVLALVGFIYVAFDGAPSKTRQGAEEVVIQQRWELPNILDEISGIALLDKSRMACVQDEDGKIFIYNLENSTIEKEIKFAGPGDFESIAIAGPTAYVLRSDGVIFEVQNFLQESVATIEHKTTMEAKFDCEGLFYDASNNRLLLAIKDKAGDDFKPVFGFDLVSKKLQKKPVYKIDFSDPVFNILERKRSHRLIRPSEIAIHPVTGNIYILEGVNPKLLILDPSGKPLKLHVLKKEQFGQAEGIAFSKEGDIYISNEGSGGPANILKITLEN